MKKLAIIIIIIVALIGAGVGYQTFFKKEEVKNTLDIAGVKDVKKS